MRAEIISVGTEILLGSTVNTDAADVSNVLAEHGVSVFWHSVVGDNPGRVEQAIRNARERANLIITTGGLGPTCDDLTKEAVARAFGLEMKLDAQAEAWVREVFEARGYHMGENNLQQAMMPVGSIALKNDAGTAPGCRLHKDGVTVIMLPGPPHECRHMLESSVRPYLASLSDGVILSRNIKLLGIGEGDMEFMVRDYMNSLTNPTLAPYAKDDECLLRVTAKAESVQEAEQMIKPVIEYVQGVFGDFIYGIDNISIAQRVMELLIEKNIQLAVAESCTGGELAKRLTDIPGASQCFPGGLITYTSRAKEKLLGIPLEFVRRHGAVSEQVARAMAVSVREMFGTDIGIGVTGLAGPDGDGVNEVGTVFICVSTPGEDFVRKMLRKSSRREQVRRQACQAALDMVRRYLTGAKVVL